MIKTITFIIILLTNLCFAQNYGALQFTNYANDRQSAFSLTFDDGLKSHYDYAKPVLDNYGFKGTFYVLPPFLAEDNQSTIWRYGRWSEFQQMADEGQEIGSHTMNHDTLTNLPWGDVNTEGTLLYELYQSKDLIEQRIASKKCMSFNYPYTIHNSVVDSAAKLFYENARAIGETPNDSSPTIQQWFGLKAKVVEFSKPRNSVDDDLDELITSLNWTQSSIDNHQWAMIIIHEVLPFDQLTDSFYQPVTTQWLDWLCDWLAQRSGEKKIWVETVGNITRYIKERENASYQIISSSTNLIEINVSDNLDNLIYNFPLSAYVKIPDNWNYVRTEQNGAVDTLTTTLTDTGRVALIKVIPDNGTLKITSIAPSYVNGDGVKINNYALYQNYPNPFNPDTKISWQSPVASWQTIKLYDALGREIDTIVEGYFEAGIHSTLYIVNSKLPSGMYFYRLTIGKFTDTKKMIYLK